MNKIKSKLSFKILLSIIIIQTFIMSIIAIYYFEKFSSQVDKRVEAQVRAPGKLINDGVFTMDAFLKKELMVNVVGESLTEAMIIGFDKTIYYSIYPEDIGKNAENLKREINLEKFSAQSKEIFLEEKNGRYLANINPIYTGNNTPFLFSYVKIGSEEGRQEKDELKLIFILSSLLLIITASIMTSSLLRLMLFKNINKLKKAVSLIGQGETDNKIEEALPTSKDELGELAAAFKKMLIEIKKAKENLENEVALRTKELQESKKDLTIKLTEIEKINDELERMNSSMINRELKMIELKNELEKLKK